MCFLCKIIKFICRIRVRSYEGGHYFSQHSIITYWVRLHRAMSQVIETNCEILILSVFALVSFLAVPYWYNWRNTICRVVLWASVECSSRDDMLVDTIHKESIFPTVVLEDFHKLCTFVLPLLCLCTQNKT